MTGENSSCFITLFCCPPQDYSSAVITILTQFLGCTLLLPFIPFLKENLLRAICLHIQQDITSDPLQSTDLPLPEVHEDSVLIKVSACGICHTDLHIIEGDLPLRRSPIVPGHQIVGIVERIGAKVKIVKPGQRVGSPWLSSTCGHCSFCKDGKENLCDNARFTGYHLDGGYAEYVVVPEESAYLLPGVFSDTAAAPLLCAGVIGYRALRLSEMKPGKRLGLYGFGASAHIAIQIARHRGCEVFVFTRSKHHHDLARELGAAWTGTADESPPHKLDSSVVFAPAGKLVHSALRHLEKGGTIALAGIHMSPIPEVEYKYLYEERTIRSVAHSTHDDVRELLKVAAEIPVRTEVEEFPLADANRALQKLKRSEIRGSGVLVV